MRARFARWQASLGGRLFNRIAGEAVAPPPGDAPFLSDAGCADMRPSTLHMADEALTLLARLIYEQTSPYLWRDADCREREKSFLAARVILQEMDAHHWLEPGLGVPPGLCEADALQKAPAARSRRPGEP